MNSEPESKDQIPQAPAQPPSTPVSFGALVGTTSNPTKTDLSAAQLEKLYRHEADERKTERFFWIGVVTVLVGAIIALSSVKAMLIIAPLQVALLIGLANWLEVEFVKRPLQQVFDWLLRKKR